jgi:hypothetical protein
MGPRYKPIVAEMLLRSMSLHHPHIISKFLRIDIDESVKLAR